MSNLKASQQWPRIRLKQTVQFSRDHGILVSDLQIKSTLIKSFHSFLTPSCLEFNTRRAQIHFAFIERKWQFKVYKQDRFLEKNLVSLQLHKRHNYLLFTLHLTLSCAVSQVTVIFEIVEYAKTEVFQNFMLFTFPKTLEAYCLCLFLAKSLWRS